MSKSRTVRVLLGFSGMLAISSAAELTSAPPTFTKDIAPILQEKCQSCHRAGSMAPMSLVTYDETRPWAKSIKQRVVTRSMPPWHLDQTVGIQHFQNDMSLTDAQISTIARWVDAGAPQGNPKDMPPAKQWPKEDGWQLAQQFGQPDFVISSDPYTMPAKGQDVWFKPLTADSDHRAALGSRRRDAARDRRRPQDHASRARLSPAGGARNKYRHRHAGPADGMGRQQELRYLPSRTPASCSCPARASGGKCTITPSAKRFAITWNWRSTSIRKARNRSIGPSYRVSRARPDAPHRHTRHSAEFRRGDRGLSDAESARPASRISSRTCTCAAKPCCSKRFCRTAPSARSATWITSTSTG